MRSHVLRSTETYPEYILIEESNSFGDQILKIRYENKDGMQKYVWTEINHEGNHRPVESSFISRMRSLCDLDDSKVKARWG